MAGNRPKTFGTITKCLIRALSGLSHSSLSSLTSETQLGFSASPAREGPLLSLLLRSARSQPRRVQFPTLPIHLRLALRDSQSCLLCKFFQSWVLRCEGEFRLTAMAGCCKLELPLRPSGNAFWSNSAVPSRFGGSSLRSMGAFRSNGGFSGLKWSGGDGMGTLGFRKPNWGFARRRGFAVVPVRGDGTSVAEEGGISGGGAIPVLVIGGGGREHALCYAFQRSPTCSEVYCAPGNAGIASSRDAICLEDLNIRDSTAVIEFCQKSRVGLVVVGPEAPLVAGLVDDLADVGISAFGPSAAAAALEGSKDFMKRLCDKYAIPTAKYQSFTDAEAAKKYIEAEGVPIVVKADGLAAGKGVVVAFTLEEAFAAVDSMLVSSDFGSAGGLVLVEEFLDGEEVSFFAIVDGENAVPMASAQDHKRVGDGDTGPNTGGMGAYSPAPALSPDLERLVSDFLKFFCVAGNLSLIDFWWY